LALLSIKEVEGVPGDLKNDEAIVLKNKEK